MTNINPMLILIVGGGLALLLLLVGVVLTYRSSRSLVEERLDKYLGEETLQAIEAEREAQRQREGRMDKQLARTGWWEKVSRDLARANLRLKPMEYIWLRLGLTVVGTALGYGLGGGTLVFTLAGLVLGYFSLGMFVKMRQGQRLRRFNSQLPDMLNLMVNGLRAGYSTLQALEAVSREMPDPISTEFRRVVREVQIGIPLEDALDNMLRRIPSDDLDLVVTAINIQREVGGNLADILETISTTIRDRVRLKGEIRVLTSQVRFSGTALAILPIALFFLIYRMNPSYMGQLIKPDNPAVKPIGYCIIGTGLILIAVGYVVMNKIADIEV
ncbi:MAG TPA: secretion system protein [Chloroflexi bacterium]|nr:secretion system protein [Chloroflexota bacterium]